MIVFNNKIKTRNTILFVVFSVMLVIAPDLLFKMFQFSPVIFTSGKVAEIVIFVVLIMLAHNKYFRRALLVIYGIFYCMEICHRAFFGSVSTPYTYIWMMGELRDTATGALSSINLIYAPLCVIIPFAVLIYLDYKLDSKITRFKTATYLLFSALVFMAVDVNRQDRSFRYAPNREYLPTFIHTTRKLNFIIFKAAPRAIFGGATKNFAEYEISKIASPEKVNIIYIWGESGNPNFMSLFGSGVNKTEQNSTTPFLDQYANDNTFFYKSGYSSSVSTTYSTDMCFYMQREPENFAPQQNKRADMIALAKQNNFSVFFISTNTTEPASFKLADKYFYMSDFAGKGEEEIVNHFPKISELKSKNLIIYHQNIMHFDYRNHYQFDAAKWSVFRPETSSIKDTKIAEYKNAVLYWDHINKLIFEYAENIAQTTNAPTYIVYMSDHGELIGSDKRGHSMLLKEVATIPIFVKCFNCNAGDIKPFRAIKTPTHYRINEKILNLLGYHLKNPNDDGKTFYINGKSLRGDDGFITMTDE